jgi:hypothetical protein
MNSWRRMIVGVLAIPVLQGCLPASTFQTPSIVQPGQRVDGIGLTAFYDFSEEEPWFPVLDFYRRYPLRPGRDYGLRIGVPNLVAAADIKFEISNAPVPAALDIAACLCGSPGLIPSLLIGSESAFAVLKFPVTIVHTGPGLALGSLLDNILVEMNVYHVRGLHPDDEREPGVLVTFGAAIQRRR